MRLKQILFAGTLLCIMGSGPFSALYATPGTSVMTAPPKADSHEVTGRITDESGEPVAGVFVIEKGTQNGVMSLSDGTYSIKIENIQDAQLEFSCIGFHTAVYDIGNRGIVDVVLESDNELDEAVVVGAGTQKKISVIGAISSVQGDVLQAPTSSLTSNLAGKLAGVFSMTTSGEPGAASEFYIRGIGTFGGRTQPLILLDDVEISVGDLNRIPAETIKSFTILKDASATAIYGVRGANGVMLVTTKTGRANTRTEVNVTVENSFVQPVNKVDFVDGATWMELYNEATFARGGTAEVYSKSQIDLTRSHDYPYLFPDVDWDKLLFRDFNMNQRANINISGGGNRATYYMSLNMNHNTGIVNAPSDYMFNNNIQQYYYNFQNNISYNLTRTTKLDLKLNAQIGEFHGPSEGASELFNYMLQSNPVMFPAYYPTPEGGEDWIYFGNVYKNNNNEIRLNPYSQMLDDNTVAKDNKINVALHLDQNLDFITKGLSLNAIVNWNSYANSSYQQSLKSHFYTVEDGSWTPENPDSFKLVQVGEPGEKFITENYSEPTTDQVFYFDAKVNYNRTFKKHSVGALLMYSMRDYRPNKSLSERNQGFSGRVNYNYDERYFVELNFGYNGTERLAPGHRFEFFPAASVGWVPSNEKFWEPVSKVIDYFKVRGSYGLIGSDGFNFYEHFVYFDKVNLQGGGGAVFGPSSSNQTTFVSHGVDAYKVDDATWEHAVKLDIGFDLSLFHQVNITFDWFLDNRSNIMMQRGSWPDIMGYWNAIPWAQIGRVKNQGAEFSVNWQKYFGKDWRLDTRINFSYAQNEYVAYDEPDYPEPWRSKVGRPLDGFYQWGYIADGLFESQEDIDNHAEQQLGSTVRPGDVKYRDVNGDGKITDLDKVQISPYGSTPRIQYGIGINVGYKKWDLGVFFNGSAMRTIMISGITPFGTDAYNVMEFIEENRWQESNPDPNAQYPRLGINETDVRNNLEASTYWLRDGSFLRFKTLELGYSFNWGRIYLNGDNIAVWSPFKEWDPELNWNSYPLSRTFTLGIQFKF